MYSDHFIEIDMNQSSPLLLVAIMLLVSFIVDKLMIKYGLVFEYSYPQVKEGLPRFYDTIRYSNAKMILYESENMK